MLVVLATLGCGFARSIFFQLTDPHPSIPHPPNPIDHHTQEVVSLGAVAASNTFMSAKEIAAFLADEIRAITGAYFCSGVLCTFVCMIGLY